MKINAYASGRNDLEVDGRKISGSAYKLKLGKTDGTGRRSLHHGTMMLDVELDALQKYLNPNKKKLESKGVDSVIARVMNLKEVVPEISHESFCTSLENEFIKKWASEQTEVKINRQFLKKDELLKIPELVDIFEGYSKWDWRFGETPTFKHQLEHKFAWALMDVQFNVEKGIIVTGKVFSDCLYPPFIDRLNSELASG